MTKKFLHTLAIFSTLGMSGSINATPCVCIMPAKFWGYNTYCNKYAIDPIPTGQVIYGQISRFLLPSATTRGVPCPRPIAITVAKNLRDEATSFNCIKIQNAINRKALFFKCINRSPLSRTSGTKQR